MFRTIIVRFGENMHQCSAFTGLLHRSGPVFFGHRHTPLLRTCLAVPRGREAAFAGLDARSEERNVVNPPKRRATQQAARKGASHMGFAAPALMRGTSRVEWLYSFARRATMQ